MTQLNSATMIAIVVSIAMVIDTSQASVVWQPDQVIERRAEPAPATTKPAATTTKAPAKTTTKAPAKTTANPPAKPTTKAPAAPKTTTVKPKTTTVPVKTTSVAKGIITQSAKNVPATSSADGTNATATTVVAPSDTPQSNGSSGISGGAIGGIIAAVVVCVAGVAAFVIIRRKKSVQHKRRKMSDPFTLGFGNHDPKPANPSPSRAMTSNNQYNQGQHVQPMSPGSTAGGMMAAGAAAYGVYGSNSGSANPPYSPEQSMSYYQTQPQYYGGPNAMYSPPLNAAGYNAGVYGGPNPNASYPGSPEMYHSSGFSGYYPGNQYAYNNGAPMSPQAYGNNPTSPAFGVAPPPPGAAGAAAVAAAAAPAVAASVATSPASSQQTATTAQQQPSPPQPQIVTATLVPAPEPQKQPPTTTVESSPNPQSLGVFTVVTTYTPTLGDELDIQPGDRVEIFVEYDDGWCLGTNLSKGNAQGVFPKHCVQRIDAASSTPAASSSNPPGVEVRLKRGSSMYNNQQRST